MRSTLTPCERRLWSALKRFRIDGFHFRRQAPFRGYFLDFVCFSARLVIEVDGSVHGDAEQAAHDRLRDAVLTREGLRVLRFWNRSVNENVNGVVDAIRLALREQSPP